MKALVDLLKRVLTRAPARVKLDRRPLAHLRVAMRRWLAALGLGLASACDRTGCTAGCVSECDTHQSSYHAGPYGTLEYFHPLEQPDYLADGGAGGAPHVLDAVVVIHGKSANPEKYCCVMWGALRAFLGDEWDAAAMLVAPRFANAATVEDEGEVAWDYLTNDDLGATLDNTVTTFWHLGGNSSDGGNGSLSSFEALDLCPRLCFPLLAFRLGWFCNTQNNREVKYSTVMTQ